MMTLFIRTQKIFL